MKIERDGDHWVATHQGPVRLIVAEGHSITEVCIAMAEIVLHQKARK